MSRITDKNCFGNYRHIGDNEKCDYCSVSSQCFMERGYRKEIEEEENRMKENKKGNEKESNSKYASGGCQIQNHPLSEAASGSSCRMKPKVSKTLTCQICGAQLTPSFVDHYVSRSDGKTGFFSYLSATDELKIFDTYDCPACGSQIIAQHRNRRYVEPLIDEDDTIELEGINSEETGAEDGSNKSNKSK